jgi:hypothetical protein
MKIAFVPGNLNFNKISCFVIGFQASLFFTINLLAQCTLSGNYQNTNAFQNALNVAAANNCSTVTLTGTAQWATTVNIPPSVTLIIAGGATILGNGSVTSDNPIFVDPGATFNTNGNDVIINGEVFNYDEPISGPFVIGELQLPVELESISASSRSGFIEILWTTAMELNTDYFLVEKSLNGVDFFQIGTVNASGNSFFKKQYSYNDSNPVNGINYYRLKQLDLNGAYTYSWIVATHFDVGEYRITCYPNPVLPGTELHLKCGDESAIEKVTLTDINGRATYLNIDNSGSSLKLQIPGSLPTGIYLLQYHLNGNCFQSAKISVK